MSAALKKEAARAELWRRGNLKWKLSPAQYPIYDLFEKLLHDRQKKGFVRTSRRFGKTYAFLDFAFERATVEKELLIPYAAPTIKHLKTVTIPIANEILQDCPKDLRMKFHSQDGAFINPKTGSKVLLGAAENGHAEKFRGIRAKYALIDECGVIKDLRYLINDVLLPTLMYDDGFIMASGTPPTSPDHYYSELAAECEVAETSIHRTIWDNDRMGVKEVLEFADALGCEIDWDRLKGEHDESKVSDKEWGKSLILQASTAYRRELLAEIVIDEEWAVIPEFTDEKEAQICVEWERPEFCYKYVVIDTGFIDFTAVVFGYYDFLKAKVVIEDEYLVDFRKGGMNATKLANMILEKEEELWGGPAYLRFGDGDLIVLNELTQQGLTVNPVKKDELEAQVNSARVDIANGKLIIHPRCVHTIAHAKYAVWNRQRTQFARTENCGHYDALAALIYFVRHVNRNDNPWPADYGVDYYTQHVPEGYGQHPQNEALKKMFLRGN